MGSIPPDDTREAVLGVSLTQLLDRRRKLINELVATDDAIYQELVNRLTGQFGTLIAPLLDRERGS